MKPIRVLLADDHRLFRAGIRALLERLGNIEIVGEATTGREALQFIETDPPDVVLMDILMPEMNGLDATARVAARFPAVRVIILSMNVAEEYIRQAWRAGASGYLLKNVSPEELELAIKTVARGDVFLGSAVSKSFSQESINLLRGQANPLDTLSPRQREVLQLVVEGRKSKEIAKILGVTIKTIEMHRALMMTALDINDVPGLVRYAIRVGLISSDI
jgi:DNA-binding NarL/FixJ family response regulator